jgi:class 3 adenylate cyclase
MNLASRLCDEAGSGQIVVNERVFAEVEHLVEAEPAGELTLKGFVKPMSAFRILDVVVNAGAPGSPVASEADRPAKPPQTGEL